MVKVNCEYKIKEDIEFLLETEKQSVLELSEKTKISRTTIEEVFHSGKARYDVCEKFYSYAYERKYRINSVKEDILKETNKQILFHGSKEGLSEITLVGSRSNCDFGQGFYLGENYNQALSFVYEKEGSSIYAFSIDFNGLNILKLDCNLDWMLAICYFRGRLNDYTSNKRVNGIVKKIEQADVIIAPIADNKMFYIMSQFTEGEINADVALHSLSASKLGLQYIIKTERALNRMIPLEKLFVSKPEREECKKQLNQRSYEIDTKLKLTKRQFKSGLYIEEILS